MNNLLNSKYGCWVCAGTVFRNKYDALSFANQTNRGDISFYFHDHIWENYDRSLLGKTPLTVLYKERAQQLRDTYDHLVLHYSGGSDSHNILHTFLSNNIPLDEISVRWAKPLRDGKFYTPNSLDRSAKNSASEWDFAIKPTLEYIKTHHPEITITVVDFTENLHSLPKSVKDIENSLLDMKLYRGALGSFVQRFDPAVEIKSSVKSIDKKIAHIFGIEKPLLSIKGDNIYFSFADASLETAVLGKNLINETAELFYWTPDMPLLALEQAYQVALYFKNNPNVRNYLWGTKFETPEEANLKTSAQTEIVKEILYKNSWIFDRFQVGKPNIARSDWWHWIHDLPELNTLRENFILAMNNVVDNFDPRSVIHSERIPIIKPITTKLFHILSLDK